MPLSIELTLTSIAPDGRAIGYRPDNEQAVVVADAIPGERVRVEIVESEAEGQQENWLSGRLLAVLEASPDRVPSPCPYFGPPTPVALPDGSMLNPDGAPRCGGCMWQHIAYERQLALKREIVVNCLADAHVVIPAANGLANELTNDELVDDVIALGDPTSQDEDAVLAFGFCTEMDFGLDRNGRLSLPARTGGLVAVDECLLHQSQLAQLFAAFAVDPETGAALAEELTGVSLAVGGTGDLLADGQTGSLVLESRRGDLPQLDLDLPINVFVRRPAGEDAQADLLVGEWTHAAAVGATTLAVYPPLGERRLFWPHVLGNEALPMIAGSLLEVQPFDYLLDIWAGFGANSVILAEQVATIVAVEDDPLAGAGLQSNLAGVDNVDFLGGPPERVLGEMVRDNYRVHGALLSPPDVADVLPLLPHLIGLGVGRLAIVAEDCHGFVASLGAIQSRGYGLTAIQPVDLQPHQSGVTLIARFDRLAESTPGYVPPVYQPPPQSRPARPARSEESPRRAKSRRRQGTKKGSGTKRSR